MILILQKVINFINFVKGNQENAFQNSKKAKRSKSEKDVPINNLRTAFKKISQIRC